MRLWFAICFFCFADVAMAQSATATLDAALIRKIESEMVMPADAKPVAAYTRFYRVGEIDGRAVIEGVYLISDASYYRARSIPVEGISNAFIMKPDVDLPLILDGGCGVVEMVFDLKLQSLWRMRAAGEPVIRGAPEPTGLCHGLA